MLSLPYTSLPSAAHVTVTLGCSSQVPAGVGPGQSFNIMTPAPAPAVTPVVGYLGRLDVHALERLSKARAADPTKKSPTLMAIALEELLSRESVDARVVPGVGPMPVFNAHAPPERPLQIWGLTAQILHAVMRVVVGPRAEYADALYGPFMRKTRSNA